jgi:hypothetical protein
MKFTLFTFHNPWFKLVVCISVWLLLILSLSPINLQVVGAQSSDSPLQAELTVERTNLDRGEATQAWIVLRNTQPYTLTNISITSLEGAFKVGSLPSKTLILPPLSSYQNELTITAEEIGKNQIVLAVDYNWQPSPSRRSRNLIETITANINVERSLDFDWPEYLIPLILGFGIGKFGSWLDERRKQKIEDRKLEHHVRGAVLALMYTARKGVEEEEKIEFALWEDVVIKANLYPALQRLARNISDPELASRIAELPISIDRYNRRLESGNLPEGYTHNLSQKITDLIRRLKKYGGL